MYINFVDFSSAYCGTNQMSRAQIIVVDYRCCREAPGSSKVKRGSYGGSGTGTTLTGTGTHMQWSSGTNTKDSGTGTPGLLEYQCTFGTDTTLTGTGTNMRSL